ncbi:unnamed protein product [Adineta steineri]|uniref:G-protein coupled receptors family 1 profile domain-containing protein n=1 Tax=Adineta steineri TaxID=433720 RepID=A0A818V016_9BILA|nr:unnamed protein product [Adineta steineri]CAF3705532.1 unnamed protein product [Adineta steineri]
MTSTTSLVEDALDNFTSFDISTYTNNNDATVRPSSTLLLLFKWFFRFTCVFIVILCPWANYKLIQIFQTHPFYKDSSSKWYITFKAIFDIIYTLISLPIIFCLTFSIDLIHKSLFTCKAITYLHFTADDLISVMLTFLCIDRMIRITCNYRLRERCSLVVCIILTILFLIINVHNVIRFQYQDGFCQKAYLSIGDYDFDIYYSLILTSVSWTIIFIASINLTVGIYCDRVRRIQLRQQQPLAPPHQQEQQQKPNNISFLGYYPKKSDNDRLGLIDNIDDFEDSTEITIEPNKFDNRPSQYEEQDNIDLQISVCVLITSAIFLSCNLPNFILYVMRAVFHSTFSSIGYVFIYISFLPLLIVHTVSYFVFKHLAARIFPNNSS